MSALRGDVDVRRRDRDGSGTGCPLSRSPSIWKAIASRISPSHSSSVAPVATQLGRSGAYAEQFTSSPPSITIR
jgi:hypothetical protein